MAAGANKLLVSAALDELADAYSHRSAEYRMGAVVMPLSHHLQAPELHRFAQIIRDNDQVRMASAMPEIVDELFERTRTVLNAMPIWRARSSPVMMPRVAGTSRICSESTSQVWKKLALLAAVLRPSARARDSESGRAQTRTVIPSAAP